jgi:hypothetical protein
MMYNNFIPPGIARMVEGKPSDFYIVARAAYKPSDLFWTYQKYLLTCRDGNTLDTDDFYVREQRLNIVLRARRIMAQCVLIALVYPNASWSEPTREEE